MNPKKPNKTAGLTLILALGFADAGEGKGPPLPSRTLGQDIRLSNGMVLQIAAPPIADELVWADGKAQQLLRGLEVTLSFRNGSPAPVNHSLTTHIDDDTDVRVWYEPLGGGPVERAALRAQELVGGSGYRTTMAPGGIAVAGACVDNNPVSINDARGNHIGLVVSLCTRPKETDQVRFMFWRPRVPSRAVLEVVRCGGCPTGGFAVDLGERRP
jgi:hypothetical protein